MLFEWLTFDKRSCCAADPTGKHVVILEDLIDTGGTLKWLLQHLQNKNTLRLDTITFGTQSGCP